MRNEWAYVCYLKFFLIVEIEADFKKVKVDNNEKKRE